MMKTNIKIGSITLMTNIQVLDAESVEAYDGNELDEGKYNDDMDDAKKLNDLINEMNCHQVRSLIQDNLEKNLYS